MSVPRIRAGTRDFWQDQVNAWRGSDLSKAAFCREVGVQPASFSQWSRCLSSSPSPGVPFASSSLITSIPVSVVDEPSSVSQQATRQSVIANRAGSTLALPATLDAKHIGTWLSSIASFYVQHDAHTRV